MKKILYFERLTNKKMFYVAVVALVSLHSLAVESVPVKKLVLHDDQSVAEKIHSLEATIALMNATFTKEVNDLKATLQAEKRERCQVGTASFHKLQCSTQHCTEDVHIQFNPTFTAVPSVVFAIEALDVDAGPNLRFGSTVSHVSTSGATLTVSTWADTIVYGSGLSWMACPK